MKFVLALLICLNISCRIEGQEKNIHYSESFDTIHRLIGEYGDSTKYKPRKKSYWSYLVMNQDTVLLSIQEYKYFDSKKDTIIKKESKVKKELGISNSAFIVNYSGELVLLKKNKLKYSYLDKIGVQYETFYDDFGGSHEVYFPAGSIENFNENEYLVIYPSEGGYKIGIFEITEEGITHKFLSKGCLFYEDWYEWGSFYEIKDGKIFLNYLIDPNRDEVGQVELKYDNGKYSLDLNQCN
tara:strand:- start:786 stop:1505 length:720 start_codon:yes stop_codon:yes gene_type:complete